MGTRTRIQLVGVRDVCLPHASVTGVTRRAWMSLTNQPRPCCPLEWTSESELCRNGIIGRGRGTNLLAASGTRNCDVPRNDIQSVPVVVTRSSTAVVSIKLTTLTLTVAVSV